MPPNKCNITQITKLNRLTLFISALAISARDDTASFKLGSLDELNHIQYGEGHFLDAHTGRAQDGDPRSFDFTMQVIHKNSQDTSKPYLRYQDNEGIINIITGAAFWNSFFGAEYLLNRWQQINTDTVYFQEFDNE